MKNLESVPIEQTQRSKSKKQKIKKGIATHFANEQYIVKKKWYEELPDDPNEFEKVSQDEWVKLKDEAKKCNDTDVVAYNVKSSKTNSEYKWMKTAMAKGTVADKIAAYIILIQDEPVYNLSTIYNIISMIKVGKKKECITAIETLTELMLSDLLRPNVKLKAFYDRPLSKLNELSSGNVTMRRKILSYWYFEDQLKEYYTTFVQAINAVAHDTVEINKEKAIIAMYKLLVGNPEQEKNLLSYIVNKLGDPSRKVASKSIYCLGQVIYEHPNMKQVVLNEIERLLFRPNVSTRAQYYGICFLTQYVLNVEDYDVAKNLIAVYFAFFKACVKKKQVDSRMMSALLTGVNRAYPFARTEITKLQEHIDTMYKIVHVATFNVSIHSLNLLYQISKENETNKDRFYRALYKKLQDPEVSTTKYQALFLNLVYRSLKVDTKLLRIKAFIKRLFQVALQMQPAMACGVLFLIQQIMREKKYLLALKNVQTEDSTETMVPIEEILKDVEIHDIEENTIEKKEKRSDKISKHSKENTGIQINVAVIEEPKKPEEEKPDKEELDENLMEVEGTIEDLLPGNVKIKSEYNHPKITNYNPLSRDPLYAGGKFCVYVELLNLRKHFHPTVALYASKIMNAENIMYSGDPLKDFTLTRFLERFSFKNPKTLEQIEKKGIHPIFAKKKLEVPRGIKSYAVNSASYLNHNEKNIPVEERFMYTYLIKKQQEKKKTTEEDEEDDSDIESVASDEFEDMLDKMSGSGKMDELDFMNDVGESLKNTKKGKKRVNESDSDDGDEEEDDDDEEAEGDDDFGDEDIDDVDENEDFGDDDDEDLDFDNDLDNDNDLELDSDEDMDKKAKKNKKKLKKKGKNDDLGSVFASADEFASMLDEDNDYMAGTSQAVSNKDNAHLKQITWEQNRDRWLKGYNSTVGKGGKKFSKNKSNKQSKNFSNKRPKHQQGGNKNKKQKKK